jgi:pimeloyl-ACP methyl ester carboxylesterase
MAEAEDVLSYQRSGSGPTLVLVHGVAGSQMVWDPLVPLLEGTRTVVRMDLVGYGSSPPPHGPCTPRSHVAAIRTTLRESGAEPPYGLVGLSMGSNLALAYACTWPDEVDTIVGLAFPYFATPEAARVGLKANVWTRLTLARPRLAAAAVPPLWNILRRSGAMRFHRGIYTPAMAQDALRVDFGAFASSVRSCMVSFPYDEMLARTASIPRLFVHGSADRWAAAATVERTLAPFDRTRFSVIDGAPHNIVVTEPEKTAEAVLAFLAAPTDGAAPT